MLVVMVFFYGNMSNAFSETDAPISNKLKELESNSEGRLGIFALNTENGHVIGYRAGEIFPTQCTSIIIGVATVLKNSMSDPSLLSQRIQYAKEDLEKRSPVTKKFLLEGMMVQQLCSAAITFSDITAMKLLLKLIGGVQGMNSFARAIGDPSFRQDNDWPKEAFSGGAGNLKDSSTPQAMVESFKKLTMGHVLERPQRDMFVSWLINTETGRNRIRAGIPKGWIVGNKTGTGAAYGSTNDIAIVWPPKHAPILIGIYYTSHNKKAIKREDIVSAATKVLIEAFITKDKSLKSCSGEKI